MRDMTVDIRSGFAETARGKIHFEVSGPAGAPALMLLAMPTTKGAMREMGLAYHEGFGADFRFLLCDYPAGTGDSARSDDPPPMTPDQVAADYLAIADAAGFDRFACAGYSVGANMSVQIAIRHPERLTALVVGGWPAIDGPFQDCYDICVRQKAHVDADTTLGRIQAENPKLRAAASAVASDFITYYAALRDWDDRAAARGLGMPRLNFADAEDMAWPENGAAIEIGPAFARNEAELRAMGWETQVLRTGAGPNSSHFAAFQPGVVVPLLKEFLQRALQNPEVS